MTKIVIKGCEVMGKVIQSFIAVFVFCVLVISPLCTPLANARINALPDAIQNHSYNWNKTVKYDRSGLRPPTVSDTDKAALASHNLKLKPLHLVRIYTINIQTILLQQVKNFDQVPTKAIPLP